jgi:hypothetical protein
VISIPEHILQRAVQPGTQLAVTSIPGGVELT